MSGSATSPDSDGDSPAPGAAGVEAGALPALEQRCGALAVGVPLRGAGGEVGVDDERQRADAAEVVEDRGDRVVGDVGEAIDPMALQHVARDDRLRAEALHHERERATVEVEHERGLAARGVARPPAARVDQRGGGESARHRHALAVVERVVVDARRLVVGRSGCHRR